jgi:hypothetical protein
MLTALLCASAVVFSAPPKDPLQMAFVARFYTPVGSKKISHSEVYVCDLNGGHLRQLTHGANAVMVRWIGRNRLVYQKYDESLTEQPEELWQIDIGGTPAKKLSKQKSAKIQEAAVDYPRVPDFLSRHRKEVVVFPNDQSENDSPSEIAKWLATKTNLPNAVVPQEYSRGSFLYLAFDKTRKELWSEYWTTNSTTHAEYWIGKYSQLNDRFSFVVSAGQSIDFDIRRNQYAYTTARDLAPYDKKRQVWVSKLFVGDQKTGKIRQIDFKKVVQFFSVSLRP